MRWLYPLLIVVSVVVALFLSGCRGSSGTVAGLSDDDLRGDYGPGAADGEEPPLGGGLYGGEYDSNEAAPPSGNRPPVIESVSFVGDTILVIASDPDGDPLSYYYIVLSGEVIVSPTGDSSSALVTTLLDDEVACEIKVIVSDRRGGEDSATVSGTIAGHPPGNSIWMLPDKGSVSIGEPVTVTVYAYEIADPLLYLDSAMIEFNGFLADTLDGKFNTETMNLGAVGGAVDEPDGIWTGIPDANYGLFVGAMSLYGLWDASYLVNGERVPEGRQYLAVNVSPLFTTTPIPAGSSGALFNFTMIAQTAGIATFKFVREYSRNRDGSPVIAGTLYSSTESEHHTFSDQQVATIEVT